MISKVLVRAYSNCELNGISIKKICLSKFHYNELAEEIHRGQWKQHHLAEIKPKSYMGVPIKVTKGDSVLIGIERVINNKGFKTVIIKHYSLMACAYPE